MLARMTSHNGLPPSLAAATFFARHFRNVVASTICLWRRRCSVGMERRERPIGRPRPIGRWAPRYSVSRNLLSKHFEGGFRYRNVKLCVGSGVEAWVLFHPWLFKFLSFLSRLSVKSPQNKRIFYQYHRCSGLITLPRFREGGDDQ